MKSNKEKIIDSARELFASKGYEVTTIDQIVRHAAVSKGLVYHFYKSKVDLLRDIISSATMDMVEQFDEKILDSDQNQLVEIIKLVFDNLREQKVYYQFNISLLFQPATSELIKDLIIERSTQLYERVYQIFIDRFDQDPKLSTYIFLAEIDGVAVDLLVGF